MSETPESAAVNVSVGDGQASLWALTSAETQAELVFETLPETLPEKQAAPQFELQAETEKSEPAPAAPVQPHVERRAEPRFESRAETFLDAQFRREADTPAEVQLEVLTGRPAIVDIEPPVGTELDVARFDTPADPLLETRPEAHIEPPACLQNAHTETTLEPEETSAASVAGAPLVTPVMSHIDARDGVEVGAELDAKNDAKNGAPVEDKFDMPTEARFSVPQREALVAPRADSLLEVRPVAQVDPQADVFHEPEIETKIESRIESRIESKIETSVETPAQAQVEIRPVPPVETQPAIKIVQPAEEPAEDAPERGIEKQLEAPLEKRVQTLNEKPKAKAEAPTLASNERPFRVKLRGSVLVLIKLPNKRQLRAALHQLSTSGGVINLEKPLDEKIEVELIFHIDRSTIRGKAQMLFPMWATQGWMQPFRFVEMSETDREALKDNLQSFIGNMAKSASANG